MSKDHRERQASHSFTDMKCDRKNTAFQFRTFLAAILLSQATFAAQHLAFPSTPNPPACPLQSCTDPTRLHGSVSFQASRVATRWLCQDNHQKEKDVMLSRRLMSAYVVRGIV